MATQITDECIHCGACEPVCPTEAISEAEEIYVIDPHLCTECVGSLSYVACAAVCPVDCCLPDADHPETEEVLLARARRLHPERDWRGPFPSRFRSLNEENVNG